MLATGPIVAQEPWIIRIIEDHEPIDRFVSRQTFPFFVLKRTDWVGEPGHNKIATYTRSPALEAFSKSNATEV